MVVLVEECADKTTHSSALHKYVIYGKEWPGKRSRSKSNWKSVAKCEKQHVQTTLSDKAEPVLFELGLSLRWSVT